MFGQPNDDCIGMAAAKVPRTARKERMVMDCMDSFDLWGVWSCNLEVGLFRKEKKARQFGRRRLLYLAERYNHIEPGD